MSFEKYLTDRAETLETYRAMASAEQRIWRTDYDAHVVAMSPGNLFSRPHMQAVKVMLFNNFILFVFIGVISIFLAVISCRIGGWVLFSIVLQYALS
jgi:hypothetical protein